MAHIVDKIVFGFSITFMVLFAIPICFGTDSIFSTSMPPVLALAIVCWNAQDDKMPKYDKLPKVKMPK